MLKLIIAVLLLQPLLSFSQPLISETFDESSGQPLGWTISPSGTQRATIHNGQYQLANDEETGHMFAGVSLAIDNSRAYEIVTTFKFLDGKGTDGRGIMFGRDGASNYQVFVINSNGLFNVGIKENGNWSSCRHWVKSSAINTGINAWNTLKIVKRGIDMVFYINETPVHSMKAFHFAGDLVGFVLYKKQKIAADYFNISYIADKEGASLWEANPFIIYEEFNNNYQQWPTGEGPTFTGKIENGKYFMEHKEASIGFKVDYPLEIDVARDFEIRTRIHKTGGDLKEGYGLILGLKDWDNQHSLLVSGESKYWLGYSENGTWVPIENWVSYEHINNNTATYNELKIIKKGDNISVVLNSGEATSTKFRPFYGNNFGFVIYGKQEVAIDYFIVRYIDTE